MGSGAGGFEGATLTLIGLVATFIASVATGSWRARGFVDDKIAKLRDEAADRQDEILRQTGEGLAALRQKANDMELWNRDHFVRRSDFQNAVDGFVRAIDSLRVEIKNDRTELKEELARLNDMLVQLIQGRVGPPVR
jgi:hypothetical protein